MKSAELKPVLKWPGGKNQIITELLGAMPLKYEKYYEPFIGAGALFLKVQPKRAVINDINKQLLNVYTTIHSDWKKLYQEISKLDNAKIDKDFYMEVRSSFNKSIIENKLGLKEAAEMIWLNKHCFNGLYRVNSNGLFNVPFNNRVSGKSVNLENIKGIHDFLNGSKTEIRNVDFEDACKDVKKGDFVYFDSPYIPESLTSNFTSYTKDGFTYNDHLRLSKLYRKLDKKGAYVMLSNNNVPLVHELYHGYNITEIEVRRNINSNGNKRKGKEVIITNYLKDGKGNEN